VIHGINVALITILTAAAWLITMPVSAPISAAAWRIAGH
jgi:hypothetical protein